MAAIVIIFAALIGAGVSGFFMYRFKAASSSQGGKIEATLKEELELKSDILIKFRDYYASMADINSARAKIQEIKGLQEGLKAERGRITITQAELETVENRLRELEEIERELEASGLETKEEITILEKKQNELVAKNDSLKAKIQESMQQWDQLLKEIESNSRLAEGVQAAKTQLVITEDKVAVLMLQIEQGNEQYFILKRRYDALDIEYAQLYEKFSEAESMAGGSKGS
jgi:chromosome segregation ATPase